MPQDRLIHPKAGHSHKVTMLTDFEHRVWFQYLLSADDFGVMRCSAVTLQADNDALAAKSGKAVQRALDHVVASLLHTFEHQGRQYVFQHDWQDYQKIEWPRASNQPQPPEDALVGCTEATRQLFAKHPGGTARRKPKTEPGNLERTSQMNLEHMPSSSQVSRACAPAERLTANGSVLSSSERERERKPSASSKWPIFKGLRLVVHEWQLTAMQATLGPFAEHMEWDTWLDAADRRAYMEPIIASDWWPWLQSELLIHARREGWPVAAPAQKLGKQTTNLQAALANIKAEAEAV